MEESTKLALWKKWEKNIRFEEYNALMVPPHQNPIMIMTVDKDKNK